MTGDRVDDLLKELDEALAVEPSPSLAARVRTRIARQPAAPLVRWRTAAAAAAMAAVVGAGYAVWRLDEPVPAAAHTQALNRGEAPTPAPRTQAPNRIEAPAAVPDTPPTAPSLAPDGSAEPTPGPALRASSAFAKPLTSASPADGIWTVRRPEPEVIVSPEIRFAVRQLSESKRAEPRPVQSPPSAEQVLITPATVEVSALMIEVVPMGLPPTGTGAGVSPENDSAPAWPDAPFPRTRRTL